MPVKTIAAARFKERCLALLDRLEPDGMLITKHGRPVAVIRPAGQSSSDLIGSLRGKIKVRGNLMRTGVKWDAGD
jgi:antitoxin (DNA-binding transcriptional repressor) of toxin-antitoxin stability system